MKALTGIPWHTTTFRNWVPKDVTELGRAFRVALIQVTGIFIERGNLVLQRDVTDICTMERSCEETARGQLPAGQREASGETKPATTLVLVFQPLEFEKINFYCLTHPVCGILLWFPSKLTQMRLFRRQWAYSLR